MEPEQGKKFILLIEDEDIMVKLLQRKLEEAGYLVQVAKDGVRGLELARTLKPDLVLLDMLLPRLNGFGILEKLYAEKILPKLPIMIISNSGQEVEVENAIKLGVRDYLIKVNFDPDELLKKVNLLIAKEEATQKTDQGQAPRKTTPGKDAASILIVEDDAFLSDLLLKKFSEQNYKIYRALDVTQAREKLAEHPIDAILLDVILPGTDGLTFLNELKQNDRYKNIPVIITSNLSQQDSVERGAKAGAAGYIVKANVSPDEIVTRVNEVIKENKK